MSKGVKKKWKRWQKITVAAACVLLLAGVGFMLFPTVSNFIGQKTADSAVKAFDDAVENITETITAEDGAEISSLKEAKDHGMVDRDGLPVDEVREEGGRIVYGYRILYKSDLDRLFADSLAYNEMLLSGQGTQDTIQYNKPVFDLYDYGIGDDIYAYVTIDAIDMRLPVYLGADESVLCSGAAHLYGTSLPVGEGSYNCAIAGHTNYVGRIFFDNLKKLGIGDTVQVTTYWDTREYEVIDYKIVTPDVTDDLLIQKDRQLLTLITCIWQGRGSEFDRYIVTCERKKQ